MLREMMKSKLHNITVTEANVDYQGSLSLDADFIDGANLMIGERVQIVNMRTGDRFETYIIEKSAGSKTVGLNGGAAILGRVGDRLLVISYALMDEKECKENKPVVLIFDEDNNIIKTK